MESEPVLTSGEKSQLPEAQRRVETLHHTGQQAQHTSNWAILAPDSMYNYWSRSVSEILLFSLGRSATNSQRLWKLAGGACGPFSFKSHWIIEITMPGICMWLFKSSHRGSHILSSWMVHAGCVFVAGIPPSRTCMSDQDLLMERMYAQTRPRFILSERVFREWSQILS